MNLIVNERAPLFSGIFLVMEGLRSSFYFIVHDPTEETGRWRVQPPLWGYHYVSAPRYGVCSWCPRFLFGLEVTFLPFLYRG